MAGQTSYTDQALGFPGQRVGMNHKAKSLVNDLGAARQVDDFTVSVVADAFSYQFEINGIAVIFLSGVGATAESIRTGLIAAGRAIQELEGVVTFNPTAADGIRVTAAVQGVGYTPTETSTNLTLAGVTANVAQIPIPFGRAVVRGAGGARSGELPDTTGGELMGVNERIHSHVDPSAAGGNPAASSFGQDMTIVHEGQMVVEVDEAVAVGDNVFFRHTLGGDAGAVGTFRTDADTARADQITGAKWESETPGAGLAVLSLNLA